MGPYTPPPLTGNTFVASAADSLTFVRWLSGTLLCAEDMYGPRDHSFTLLGIEVDETCKFGACVRHLPDKQIIMQLSQRVASNPLEAYSCLAHETVHLLAPSPVVGSTRVIEEGVAEVFAGHLIEWQTGIKDYPRKRGNFPNYQRAADDVRELETRYGPRAIKRLRAIEPQWRALRRDHFAEFEGINAALVERLLKPFPRHRAS